LIELTDYIFDERGVELTDSVRIDLVGPVREHGTIKICDSEFERVIDSFAFITCRKITGEAPFRANALLTGVTQLNPVEHWILLLGTWRAVLIDVAGQTIHEPFPLFRSPDEDQGFYSTRVYQADESVVVEYEGGLIMVAQSRVVWHRAKKWNDLIESIDTQTIYLQGDAGEQGEALQQIDLQTGESIHG
jgi:hypothetical protein